MKHILSYSMVIAVFAVLFLILPPVHAINTNDLHIWQIRSVDTMKTSRDMARSKLNDTAFEQDITHELKLIKDLGANYVAIDTPYDDEFLPYLKRWVRLARQQGLNVWYRGNWSNWEGWFEYPKNLTPERHQAKTAEFIQTHPELFEDGDIFDPCPECENAGFWKQPEKDTEYNAFVRNQRIVLNDSFRAIKKDVHTNLLSIIGGRAKEVLTQDTLNALGNVASIDHYVADPSSMGEYVDYFAKLKTKTLVSEFGAPIPDINGPMTEAKQAAFIDSLMQILYKKREHVLGVNYFALSNGTTEIIDAKGNPKKAYDTVKKYFTPAIIRGTVTNTLGDAVANEPITSLDGFTNATTDTKGMFALAVPAEPITIFIGGKAYQPAQYNFDLMSGETTTASAILAPIKPNFMYKLRLWLRSVFS